MTKQTSDKQSLSKDQAELLFAQFALIASSHGWSSESIDKIARLQDYCLATFQPSLAAQDDWKAAALRLGEELWNVGPNGYYEFTPVQWLAWCESNLPTPPPPTAPLEHGIVTTSEVTMPGGHSQFPGAVQTEDLMQHSPASGETPRTEAQELADAWCNCTDTGHEVDRPTWHAMVVLARGFVQLERDFHKLQMEMPDYKQCCELREKAERELAEAQSATPAHLTAVEFGYRCAEKGMNLQAALSASTDESSKT